MSDTTTTDSATPVLDPVTVTLELPGRLVRWYDQLTQAGLYLSVEEALRAGILASWRFERGSFLSMRLDADAGEEKLGDEVETSREPGPATEA